MNRLKQREGVHTGEMETKLSLKEFEPRNADMKLIREGSCSSFHALLIIQTPAALPDIHQSINFYYISNFM